MLPRGYLVGRMSSDPVSGETNNAKNYTKFSVACQDIYKPAGSEEPRVIFLDCTSWGKTAEFVFNNIKKGDKVFVEFSLNIRSYTNSEGKTVRATELTTFSVDLLAKKGASTPAAPRQEDTAFEKDEDVVSSVTLDDIFEAQ